MSGISPSALHILILTDEAERLRGALMLAMSHVALGGEACLFLQLDAVRLLAPGMVAPQDGAHHRAGLPNLASLIDEALGSEVQIIACQTGLHLAGIAAYALDPRIETGGLVSFLSALSPDGRFVTA